MSITFGWYTKLKKDWLSKQGDGGLETDFYWQLFDCWNFFRLWTSSSVLLSGLIKSGILFGSLLFILFSSLLFFLFSSLLFILFCSLLFIGSLDRLENISKESESRGFCHFSQFLNIQISQLEICLSQKQQKQTLLIWSLVVGLFVHRIRREI